MGQKQLGPPELRQNAKRREGGREGETTTTAGARTVLTFSKGLLINPIASRPTSVSTFLEIHFFSFSFSFFFCVERGEGYGCCAAKGRQGETEN